MTNRRTIGLAAACGALLAAGGAALAVRPGAQTPASPDQRDARVLPRTAISIETVARGINSPWAIEPLPDGRMLITEKAGVLRFVSAQGVLSPPIAGVPAVDDRGQGGLLDVAVLSAQPLRICLSYAEPRGGGKNGTSVACGMIIEGGDDRNGGTRQHWQAPDAHVSGARIAGLKVIWRQQPAWASTAHFGSRIVPTPDGHLFITAGERQKPESRQLAQRLDTTLGKTIRINPDGTLPADNPFIGRTGALPEIWSYGHRNPQSAALDPAGRFWTVEHGPMGGDELNHPEPGRNYGWPIITYGRDYSGLPIGDGITAKAGMEQPVYYWDPVIAPSGMAFYTGNAFPGWRGDALIGGMVAGAVVRVKLANGRVVGEERIAIDDRVRDVAVGRDGLVYLVTDGPDARLLRLRPRQ